MKQPLLSIAVLLIFVAAGLGGCAPQAAPTVQAPTAQAPTGQAPTEQAPTASPSPIPPTLAPSPTATETAIPGPTALPGSEVVPLASLAKQYPWLPLDKTARPGTYLFFFDVRKPPFDNVLVRQAFAAAIDREALTKIAQPYFINPGPMTTLTPPGTLGRNLYGEVGIPFNPAHAKDLLAQAGYADASKLPPVTLLTSGGTDAASQAHAKISAEVIKMWQQTLGVQVSVETIPFASYFQRVGANPSGIFRATFYAAHNDPDEFLGAFHTGNPSNLGKFSDPEFDKLLDRAKQSSDPAERQLLYIQAERILCETQAALIPIFHATFNIP